MVGEKGQEFHAESIGLDPSDFCKSDFKRAFFIRRKDMKTQIIIWPWCNVTANRTPSNAKINTLPFADELITGKDDRTT
jgi:hypothetical protein